MKLHMVYPPFHARVLIHKKLKSRNHATGHLPGRGVGTRTKKLIMLLSLRSQCLASPGRPLFSWAFHIGVIYPRDMERQSEQVQVRLESLIEINQRLCQVSRQVACIHRS
jgi:hypothetical protein